MDRLRDRVERWSDIMSKPKRQRKPKKVGSDPQAAGAFGGRKGDFGIPADEAARPTAMPHMNPDHAERPAGGMQTDLGGRREHGVGGDPRSGPGASSGGDVDPSIVGVGGSGGGVSQSGSTGRTEGPDITEGGTTDPDTVDRSKHKRVVGGDHSVKGSTVRRDDDLAGN